jgi:hypothetical protein
MITQQVYHLHDRFTAQEAVTASNCSRHAVEHAMFRAAALAAGDKRNVRHHEQGIVETAEYLVHGLTLIAARTP